MNTKQLITNDFIDKDNFHQKLILNDTTNNSNEFCKKCSNMINSISNLDDYDLNFIFSTFFLMLNNINYLRFNQSNDIDSIEFICQLYESHLGKNVNQSKKEGFRSFVELFNNLDIYTKNEEVLKFIIDSFDFYKDLHKIIEFWNNPPYVANMYNDKCFIKQLLPFIRLMDYCLKNNFFAKYAFLVEYIEPKFIYIFFNTYKNQIKIIINQNKSNPDILYIFTNLDENNINNFFTLDLLPLLESASFDLILHLIREDIPKRYITNDFFKNGFKKFNLSEQIAILETFDQLEYPLEFINDLHHNLNKKTENNGLSEVIFETSVNKLRELSEIFLSSSYFYKNNLVTSEFWKLIQAILNGEKIEKVEDLNLYEELVNLYNTCYRYATESIVNSLYTIDTLQNQITYLENVKFNLLAIGDDAYGCSTYNCDKVEDLFKGRNFACGTILTENNFSHPRDSHHLFGFYTNIIPSSIVNMCPSEIRRPYVSSKYIKDITPQKPLLLDIDDLNDIALKRNTFSHVCIRTTTPNNQIISPNCIICINDINESDLYFAEKFRKKILVLKKNPHTIENNGIDDYRGDGETEF